MKAIITGSPAPAIDELSTIPSAELAGVSGGRSAWDVYVAKQRTAVAEPYKKVVCTTAGVKGGPSMATEVYGKGRTTESDKIRAAITIKGVCLGGSQLPEAAPKLPF